MSSTDARARVEDGAELVQSLVRAFAMLDQLAAHDEGLKLTQLARLVDLRAPRPIACSRP